MAEIKGVRYIETAYEKHTNVEQLYNDLCKLNKPKSRELAIDCWERDERASVKTLLDMYKDAVNDYERWVDVTLYYSFPKTKEYAE